MAGIITKMGYKKALEKFIDDTFTFKLYVNNYIPTYDTKLNDLVELDTSVYTPITVNKNDWSNVNITTNSISITLGKDLTFTFSAVPTSNNTVYGYFVVDSDNNLIMVERLSSPFTITNSGDSITLSGISIVINLT